MKEEQKQQKNDSLWTKFSRWINTFSLQTKIFLISCAILVLGYFFINNFNNKDIIKSLEESKKKTDEKLRAISLYEGRLDGYQAAVDDLDSKIKDTNSKIKEITSESPEKTSLDKFFDKRV